MELCWKKNHYHIHVHVVVHKGSVRVKGIPERPQSAQDTSFSGLLDFLLSVLSPRQKSQIGFGLAMGLPCKNTWRKLFDFQCESVYQYPESHWYPPALPARPPPPIICMIQDTCCNNTPITRFHPRIFKNGHASRPATGLHTGWGRILHDSLHTHMLYRGSGGIPRQKFYKQLKWTLVTFEALWMYKCNTCMLFILAIW